MKGHGSEGTETNNLQKEENQGGSLEDLIQNKARRFCLYPPFKQLWACGILNNYIGNHHRNKIYNLALKDHHVYYSPGVNIFVSLIK